MLASRTHTVPTSVRPGLLPLVRMQLNPDCHPASLLTPRPPLPSFWACDCRLPTWKVALRAPGPLPIVSDQLRGRRGTLAGGGRARGGQFSRVTVQGPSPGPSSCPVTPPRPSSRQGPLKLVWLCRVCHWRLLAADPHSLSKPMEPVRCRIQFFPFQNDGRINKLYVL